MRDKFLHAKHWQLFLLTIIPFILNRYFILDPLLTEMPAHGYPALGSLSVSSKFLPLILIVILTPLFYWFWSISTGLQIKIPESAAMKVKKFKLFFFYPVFYLMLFALYFNLLLMGLLDGIPSPGLFFKMFAMFVVIVPLHLFAMYCIIYIFYFTAKTYKTALLQRETSFGDFFGIFFLLLLFPIGVWFIQPKINKMMKS